MTSEVKTDTPLSPPQPTLDCNPLPKLLASDSPSEPDRKVEPPLETCPMLDDELPEEANYQQRPFLVLQEMCEGRNYVTAHEIPRVHLSLVVDFLENVNKSGGEERSASIRYLNPHAVERIDEVAENLLLIDGLWPNTLFKINSLVVSSAEGSSRLKLDWCFKRMASLTSNDLLDMQSCSHCDDCKGGKCITVINFVTSLCR